MFQILIRPIYTNLFIMLVAINLLYILATLHVLVSF